MSTDTRVSASSAEGSIYDLGYRHYEGRRLGRAYAFWSLFVETLRGVYGFGRSGRAKAAPFIIVGLYSIAAVLQLAFSAVISQQIARGETVTLFAYDNYFRQLGFFLILFCIAQAPEVVGRDQRFNVLPLYFTRALSRVDYALAKLAAFAVALFIALMLPMVALFVGDLLMKPDMIGALGDELPKALPAIPASAWIALGMGAMALALSAFSPRRSYSSIGLIAFFLLMQAVPEAIYAVSRDTNWTWAENLLLLRPVAALEGASNWMFGTTAIGISTSLSMDAYLAASVAFAAVALAVLLLRYRRIAA